MNFKEYIGINRWILFWGTFIRFIFAPFTGHPFDLPIWRESGELISMGISPYSPFHHLGQTILWALWTGFSYMISSSIPYGDPFVYIFLIKLLPIIADVIFCYLALITLQDEVGDLTSKKVRRYTGILYLNPVLIFASSFWGMADSIALVFILLAYRQLKNEKIYSSATYLALSIALKLYPVVLLPVFLLYIILYQEDYWKSVRFGFVTLLLFFIIAYVPFVIFPWESSEITGVLISQSQRSFGGMGSFGFFNNAFESSTFKKYFITITPEIKSIIVLRYLWLINSFLLALSILILWKSGKIKLDPDRFKVFFSMIIIFYSVWIIFAFWVSEQNTVPLLGMYSMLIFYKSESNINVKNDWRLLLTLSILITIHIIMNVPLVRFFFEVYPDSDQLSKNIIFREVRAISLMIIIFFNIVTLSILFIRHLKIIAFEKHTD